MKTISTILLCFSFIFLGMGCQTAKTKMGEGAVIGGVIGAAAGGIIGHQTHHGAEGAGIGAAVGAVTGAIVGSQIEKPGQDTSAKEVANPNQLTIQDIVQLTKEGVGEDKIIEKVRTTNSKFNLSSADINYLKQQGVSPKVIVAMQGVY